jgi:thiamine-monophosphate kinase
LLRVPGTLTLPGMTEFRRIAEIARRLEMPSRDVALGIGDDAAVLAPSPHAQVWSVDAQVEGVHFRHDWLAPAEIGYRAFVAALSDLAAMAARPRAALISLVVPAALAEAELYALVDGVAEAQREYGCPVAGGNLAAGGELSITTSVLGESAAAALTRAGARAGDDLYVTGELGGAGLGLRLLQRGMRDRGPASVQRWRRPRARIAEGLALAGTASAAIDVSDGLLQDLGHIASASRVGFEIELERLPLHDELHALGSELGLAAWAAACTSGEEYELLFTVAPGARPPFGSRIGRAVRTPGLVLRDARGAAVTAPTTGGFDHFA